MNDEKRTILIADDEKEIRELVRLYLEKDGYLVCEADNGRQAIEILRNHKISLAILDIMMPELNGYEIMKELRRDNNIPIIILSAKSQDCDRILGLDLGADDYIAKPFQPLELVARVTANLRRYYRLGCANQQETIKVRDLTLDLNQCQIQQGDCWIELTSVEYRILKLLMQHPGRVYTKQQIYEAGWEETRVVDDNSIMVCISKIRNKLRDDSYIKTIRGLGYRFEK